MYYQNQYNQYNRNRNKQRRGYIERLTTQLAVVLVALLILILFKYVDNSLFKKVDSSIRKVFYYDYTDEAVDVFNANIPGAKNAFENILSKNKEMNIEFMPVEGKIIAGFGEIENPATKKKENHTGIDIEAKEGTEIKSVMEGSIEEIKLNHESLGQTIIVKHSNGFKTLYGHLSSIEVEEGQKIKAGQVIGKVGKTGKASVSQLHFEVIKNYEPVNPMDLIKSSSN